MSDSSTIFRQEAVDRYNERREQQVLPRYIRPKMFLFFWVLVGLLVTGFCAAWFAQLPIYVTGQGIVVAADGEIDMLIITPANTEQLTADYTVWFTGIDAERHASEILTVETAVQSPYTIQSAYPNYVSILSTMVQQPSRVATATFDDASLDALYLGSQHQVEIEVGSQRLIAMVPFIGRFVGGQS